MKFNKKISVRLAMLIVSGLISAVSAILLLQKTGGVGLAAIIGIFSVICIPALWHLFIVPESMQLKDYCQVAGWYFLCWGGPIVIYECAFREIDVPDVLGYFYLAATLILMGFGAFLKRK